MADDENHLPEDFLDLAGINIGEAVALMHNLHRRRAPRTDYRMVQQKLRNATACLEGKFYTPAIAIEHASPTTLEGHLSNALETLRSVYMTFKDDNRRDIINTIIRVLDTHGVEVVEPKEP